MSRTPLPPRLAALVHRAWWSASEAREVLAAVDASGHSLADFARLHGLTYKRLWNWRSRLRDAPAPPPPQTPAFVELPRPRSPRAPSRCTLRLVSGDALHFDADIDPAALRGLLAVLRGAPC